MSSDTVGAGSSPQQRQHKYLGKKDTRVNIHPDFPSIGGGAQGTGGHTLGLGALADDAAHPEVRPPNLAQELQRGGGGGGEALRGRPGHDTQGAPRSHGTTDPRGPWHAVPRMRSTKHEGSAVKKIALSGNRIKLHER